MDDRVAAIQAAGDLIGESGQFRAEAARLRTELAELLRTAEGLSIAQLAARLDMARGTAQTLLEREKRAERRRGSE